jgi:hypothetical protein
MDSSSSVPGTKENARAEGELGAMEGSCWAWPYPPVVDGARDEEALAWAGRE